MIKNLSILFFCISLFQGISQTKKRNYAQREAGLFGGASYYIGDINARKHFFYSQPAAGIFYRYAASYRYAFRFGFNYGSIGANDAKSSEADQLERNLSFRSVIYDLHALAEFNFVDYRIGNDKHYFTMFIFAGLGGYYFNPQSEIKDEYVNLRNLKSEDRAYSRWQLNIPFGVGIKWNISDAFGLGLEWSPRKLFTDYLDDISSAYPNKGSYNGVGKPGTMRGNPRSKDWYFFYGMTLTMKLPKLNKECFEVF